MNDIVSKSTKQIVKAYRTYYSIQPPVIATTGSACFDFSYQNPQKDNISGYDQRNKQVVRYIKPDGSFEILPGDRLLVPTGIVFDMPYGISCRLHARSGLALKKGLILANSEGVIDSDYIEPIYIMLTNISSQTVYIEHNERLCQGEFVKNENDNISLENTKIKPMVKTNREGGFGSTGLKMLEKIEPVLEKLDKTETLPLNKQKLKTKTLETVIDNNEEKGQ